MLRKTEAGLGPRTLLFAAALFTAAFLLFAVQPMVSRMVLPRLGGSPSVWNTCVTFFQIVLLLGYAYADWAVRRPPAVQLALHAGLLGAGALLLPLSLGGSAPGPQDIPALWLLCRLALDIGPVFFAIATTAPLLQAWFARAGHGRDPYFLYAASNAGSFAALLLYPLAIETTLGLSQQTRAWSLVYGVAACLILLCGGLALRADEAAGGSVQPQAAGAGGAAQPRPALAQEARWLVLAFVPSALMLAVTTYITTDIAAAPLFWVGPLAIYIATFIIAFARDFSAASSRRIWLAQAVALAAAGAGVVAQTPNILSLLAALAAFATTAMAAHVTLAAERPAAQYLTRFYLITSLGGALGGVFNALVAPVLFRGPWEYPLLIVAACLLRPVLRQTRLPSDLIAGGVLPILITVLKLADAHAPPGIAATLAGVALYAVPGALLLSYAASPRRLASGMIAINALIITFTLTSSLLSARSFFGIYRARSFPDEAAIVLQHGTTVHGIQGLRPGEAATPYGYYADDGPFGRFFAAWRAHHEGPTAIGVVGLGAGALACYAGPADRIDFREIDPVVEAIARDTRLFGLLARCAGGQARVILGDARLTLARDPARYDVLVIDAFSSDSVPMHLLTREALAIYRAHLNPGGAVLFHVSNRYLDLPPVVARLADDAGVQPRHLLVPARRDAQGGGLRRPAAEIVVIPGPGSDLGYLAAAGWDVPRPGPVLWSDERADILRVIRW